MALLEMLNGDKAGQRFTLGSERAVLGRHPDCSIVLDLGAVSRQHAEIRFEGGDYFVEDLKSRNGTYVNAEQVQAATRLQNGDKLKICDLEFIFYNDARNIRQTVSDSHTRTAANIGGLFWDDTESKDSSKIMSKLDVSSGASGVRVSVNPEVKLRALLEITQNLAKSLELDAVFPKVFDSLFKIFVQADRGFIALKSPDGPVIPKAIKHRRADNDETIRISRTIVNQVLESKQAILSADAATDERFDMSQSIADFRIRSMMCAPLVNSDGDAFGVLQLDTLDQRARFTQEDLDVMAAIASQAAFAIDNAQLHESLIKKNAIERDLELARKVQKALLPSEPPQVEGYHFFDFYEAANQVGGDFYDYIPLPGGRFGIVLADVSGKGVAAAIIMARLSGDVRYFLASEPYVHLAVRKINAAFCSSGWDDRFVTFVLAVLDPARHEVALVNAGHMPPFVRRREGDVEAVAEEIAGVPIGIDADYEYESTTFSLGPNQSVALFTDGFSEAMNAQKQLYGLDRLQHRIGASVGNVAELGATILSDAKKFVGAHPQSDDMCLVCFARGAN